MPPKSARYALQAATKVNIGKLGKKIKREASASPKKAAFLALATLVAIYFWMPLVWGWIAKSNKNMAAATANSSSTSTAPAVPVVAPLSSTGATPAVSSKKESASRQSWWQTAQWIDEDARTKPAARLAKIRDPFGAPAVKQAELKPVEKTKPKPPTIAPDAAGLVLSGTIVGPGRRIAQISGKPYSVGDLIQSQSTKVKDVPSVAFRLIEVTPRRAILEADGQRFELSIPEPGKTGKMESVGALNKNK